MWVKSRLSFVTSRTPRHRALHVASRFWPKEVSGQYILCFLHSKMSHQTTSMHKSRSEISKLSLDFKILINQSRFHLQRKLKFWSTFARNLFFLTTRWKEEPIGQISPTSMFPRIFNQIFLDFNSSKLLGILIQISFQI
jgi:hypothetical protein